MTAAPSTSCPATSHAGQAQDVPPAPTSPRGRAGRTPCRGRYFMRWVVVDHDRALSSLHAEALDDLAEHLEARGLIAWSDVAWGTESIQRDDDDVIELHALVEVREVAA